MPGPEIRPALREGLSDSVDLAFEDSPTSPSSSALESGSEVFRESAREAAHSLEMRGEPSLARSLLLRSSATESTPREPFPEDTAAPAEESAASAAAFDQGLQEFLAAASVNPETAETLLPDLTRATEEIRFHLHNDSTEHLYQDLSRLQSFYQAAVEFRRSQNFYEFNPNPLALDDLENSLNTVEAALRTLREYLRQSLSSLSHAQLAAQISLDLGHYAGLTLDLRNWERALLDSDLNDAERSTQYAALIRAWSTMRDAATGIIPRAESAAPIAMSDGEINERLRSLSDRLLEITGAPEALRERIYAAIDNNESQFLGNLTAESIQQFLQLQEMISELESPLPPGEGQGEGPAAIARQFQLATLYQQMGRTEDANRILQEISASALGAWHAVPLLARTMIHLNNGDLTQARTLLEELPEDEAAQFLLAQLSAGEAQQRQAQLLQLWQGAIVGYAEHYRERGGEHPEDVQENLLEALRIAHQEVSTGRAVSLDEAMRRMRNPDVMAFIRDSHTADLMESLSRPELSARQFSEAVLSTARSFLAQENYVAVIHFAQFLQDDPEFGAEARELAAGVSTDAAIDGALASLRNMTIVFADSDRAALESGVITVATLGIARAGAIVAESAFAGTSAARVAASISPAALSAARWGVRAGTEAALFTAGGMATQALLNGSTEHLTLENFGRQFGAMLVTFGLLHLVGMGMNSLSRPVTERLARAEAAVAAARETGVGLEAATSALRASRTRAGGMAVAGWGSRVGSLTASGYINEGLGLEEGDGVSLGGRLLSSVAMDAHMTVAGAVAEGVSGGRLSRMERATEGRFQILLANARAHEGGRPVFGRTLSTLAAGVGTGLLTPEIAHAATEIGERGAEGFWPAAITGIGLLGAGVLGMVASGKETYRETTPRDARWAEIRDRILDPQRDIRDRTRAIRACANFFREDPANQNRLRNGILQLLDLAIDPRVPQAQAQYSFTPEDESRILRTLALEAVQDLLVEFPPDHGFRRHCLRKLEEFFREARDYLRPAYLKAPPGWPSTDPRYLSPETLRSGDLLPEGQDPSSGVLDVNEPLRTLALDILNRPLAAKTPRSERIARSVAEAPPEVAATWHHFLTQTPSLHFLYTALSLGLSGAGFTTFFESTGMESGLGMGAAAIGLLATFTPDLLHRLVIRPDQERRARWTEYIAENAEFYQAQREMGIRYPFAVLASERTAHEEAPPRTRVIEPEEPAEAEELENEAESELEAEQKLARTLEDEEER